MFTLIEAPLRPATAAAFETLKARIGQFRGLLVAYSGGMDSAFLTLVGTRLLGEACQAVFVQSELTPSWEQAWAAQAAQRFEFHLSVLRVNVLGNTDVQGNPENRCYFCKKEIFRRIRQDLPPGWTLCDGTTLEDRTAHRPGKAALAELGVVSPLEEAGFTKAMIREVLTAFQAEEFIRPAQPCLATRFPYGTPLTLDNIRKVDVAERLLRDAGFGDVRLRLHDQLARIEIPHHELDTGMAVLLPLVPRLKECGLRYVTLDLEGFRSGSMDEVAAS